MPICIRARRRTSVAARNDLGLRCFWELMEKVLAEVCRNRTDRSTKGRPTGFEVPGGHQPACTSRLILNGLPCTVNLAHFDWSGNCRGCLSFLASSSLPMGCRVQCFQPLKGPSVASAEGRTYRGLKTTLERPPTDAHDGLAQAAPV